MNGKMAKASVMMIVICAGSLLLVMWVLDSDKQMSGLLQPAKPRAKKNGTMHSVDLPMDVHTIATERGFLKQDEVNKERLQRLQKTCAQNHSHYITASRRKIESLEDFLVDLKHRLAYCYIPKVGSSTMKRVFHILAGKNQGQSLFSLSGRDIHRDRSSKYDLFGQLLEGETFVRKYQVLRSLTKIIFVRDPFERLFSAFIDRLFGIAENLYSMFPDLLKHRHGHSIQRNSCGVVNVTFADVIRYVTTSPVTTLEEHFGPYYSICFPCHVDYDFVGKLETFRHDASLILTSVGVEPRSVLGKDDEFDAQNDVNILHDVVKRTFEMMEFVYYRQCFTKYRMLKRTWASFQVRGFLPIEATFPLTREKTEAVTLTQFDDLVTNAYRKVANHSRVKEQRQMALREAYYSIPRDLLLRLQKVLQRDCDLFGYDCSVDARFKESDKVVPVFHFDEL